LATKPGARWEGRRVPSELSFRLGIFDNSMRKEILGGKLLDIDGERVLFVELSRLNSDSSNHCYITTVRNLNQESSRLA
jgi:hypothetical protein